MEWFLIVLRGLRFASSIPTGVAQEAEIHLGPKRRVNQNQLD